MKFPFKFVVFAILFFVAGARAGLAGTGALEITAQPQNVTASLGQTATFTVAATGTPAPAYQWQKNGVNIPGATAASYTTPATVFSDNSAKFSVVVTDNTGNITSNSASLFLVSLMPVFEADFNGPGSGTGGSNNVVTYGGTATLGTSVTIIGTAPFDSASGNYAHFTTATTGNQTVANFTPASVANSWAALCSNTTIGTTSYLVMNGGFDVFVRPNATMGDFTWFRPVDVGWHAPLRIIFNGSGTQFQMQLTNYGGTPFSSDGVTFNQSTSLACAGGGNISNFALAAGQAAHLAVTFNTNNATGAITMKVFGVHGSGAIDTTSSANLLASQTFYANAAVTGALPSGGWAMVNAPATAGTYDIDHETIRIYNADPKIFPDINASATAASAPTITLQPVNRSTVVGQTATFTAAAAGVPTPTYQWYRNGVAITGATSASYTTPAAVIGDNGAVLKVVAASSAGSVTSSPATLMVLETAVAPAITAQPASQTVDESRTATFSVTATGTPDPGFQWQKDGVNIPGATSASYTTPATSAGNNGSGYSVLVTNSAGSVISNTATLTVNALAAPAITAQPANQTVNLGLVTTFTVTAAGTPAPAFQWLKNGAPIAGATLASYTTPGTVAGDNGAVFSVLISNIAGNVTSRGAVLTVNTTPPPVSPTWATLLRLAKKARFNNCYTAGPMSNPPTVTNDGNTAPPVGQTNIYQYNTTPQLFRGFGGAPVMYWNKWVRFGCVTISGTGDGGIGSNPAVAGSSFRVEFMADANKVTLMLLTNTLVPYRFLVDDQFVSASGSYPTGSGTWYVTLDFTNAGGRKLRKIAVESSGNNGFQGVCVGAGETISQTDGTDLLRMITLGDSITQGTGATTQAEGWSNILAGCLGVRDNWQSGSGGTGYLNSKGGAAYTMRQRLGDATAHSPDIVVFAMGVNDNGLTTTGSTQQLKDEVLACISALRAALPATPLIVTGPLAPPNNTPMIATEAAIRSVVEGLTDPNLLFIPVVNAASAEAAPWTEGPFLWGKGSGAGDGNEDIYTNNGNIHPLSSGHMQIGMRTADAVIASISGDYSNLHPDGVSSNLKYFFHIDALKSVMSAEDRAALPVQGFETIGSDQYLTLTYRQNAGAPNVNAAIQVSNDMVTWTTVTPDVKQTLSNDPNTNDPRYVVKVKTTGATRKFLRLKLVTP